MGRHMAMLRKGTVDSLAIPRAILTLVGSFGVDQIIADWTQVGLDTENGLLTLEYWNVDHWEELLVNIPVSIEDLNYVAEVPDPPAANYRWKMEVTGLADFIGAEFNNT